MFGKRIELLTFDDIVDFLEQQHKEGVNLDYKLGMIDTTKVAKLACAFANSNGGLIIFGVKERDELPVEPYEGSDLGGNPSQKVIQACNSMVKPEIDPIMSKLLRNSKDQNKAFLVAAIPQSGKTPHATAKDNLVYVKVQDHKEPVQPTLDQYERMLSERHKCIVDRDRIKSELNHRMKEVWECLHIDKRPRAVIDITVLRRFPDGEDLCTPQTFIESLRQYEVVIVDSYLHQLNLPVPFYDSLDTFEKGINSNSNLQDDEIPMATVIHCEGAYRSRAFVPLVNERNEIRASPVCGLANAMIRNAFRIFLSQGCYSSLIVTVELSCLRTDSHYLVDPISNDLFGPSKPQVAFTNTVSWPSKYECDEIEMRIASRYISSFNVRDPELSESLIKQSIEVVQTHV